MGTSHSHTDLLPSRSSLHLGPFLLPGTLCPFHSISRDRNCPPLQRSLPPFVHPTACGIMPRCEGEPLLPAPWTDRMNAWMNVTRMEEECCDDIRKDKNLAAAHIVSCYTFMLHWKETALITVYDRKGSKRKSIRKFFPSLYIPVRRNITSISISICLRRLDYK